MPELPEVEVVRRELAEITRSQPKIEKIEFLRKDLRDPMPIKKLQALVGAQILAIHRRAKYLLIETSKGGILSHLGMTGTWRLAVKGDELLHDHVYIYLSDRQRLAFRDPRRFGIFEIYDLKNPQSSPRLKTLGPEPLDEEFTAEYLWLKLRQKKAPIKTTLMDQKLVVGVGNIYASEVLFQARISPLKRADRLTREQVQVLTGHIKAVLSRAIEGGGSSISDFAGTRGESGTYQDSHQVYGRQAQQCGVCRNLIKQKVMAGRSTFWCPKCQK